MRKLVLVSPLIALVSLATAQAAAPPVDPALFRQLKWRSIGPFRAGRVLAVSGVPGDPYRFYFGSVNGGVWETNDAGRTWRPIFDEQPIGTIGALALAPSNPKVIYVGTGEADMRSNIAQGDGMFRSTDGGKSWARIGLTDSQQIGRILVDPKDPDRLFVAALGHPYGPNEERGVFRSGDGGRTWKRVLFLNADTGAIDLAFRPDDARVVYAAMWQTRRPPWNVYPPSNGPGSGLYKSTDGGDTWKKVEGAGFPANPGNIGLAPAPSAPGRLYAMVDADQGGLYRSDDGGATWTHTSGDPRIWGRGWYFGEVAVEPRDADVVYAGNTSLYRSTDAGKTFAPVRGAPGGDDYQELWIDPEHPERRILGSDQGAVVSLNGGETWSSWYNQPTAQIYRLATDTRFPYWVYGSQQDSGALAIPSRTTTVDGITNMEFQEITVAGENDSIAPDPKDPNLVFGGRVERLDLASYQTATLDPAIGHPGHHRSVWTLPLIFSPRDPGVLYHSDQQVFRSADGGHTWAAISKDLTRENPGVPPNLDPATAANTNGAGPRAGVVFSIAPSKTRDRELWVGTDDGLVWRTKDEGTSWTDITPKALTPWSKVTMIEASSFDPETIYAAVDRHRLDDFAPYLYRTRDGGKTWTNAVDGIPRGSFLNAIREDPKRRGLLYAGTEKGVYVSFDDGERWQPLQAGLPVTSVRDMKVHGDDLVIGTHGRGFYILDDVSPLRQLDAKTASADVHLFAPSNAVRLRPAGFTGTPMPKDEPHASNPPAGAAVDYVLKAAPKGPVTLSILDAAGNVLRRYSSDDKLPPPTRRERVLAPEWLTPPRALPATAGAHRYHWSMRTAAPPALARGNAFADGAWAPPGRYSVELSADGRTLRQPLTIEPDPRVKLPQEAYARQFELARRVEKRRADAAAAAREAEAVHKALAERAAAPGVAASLGSEIGALDARVVALAEPQEESPRRPGPPPKSTESLPFLTGALGKLAEAVDGADIDPTPDARAGFEKTDAALTKTLAAWEAVKSRELAALNAKLEAAGNPPIRIGPDGGR